jgi:hypothetical protein
VTDGGAPAAATPRRRRADGSGRVLRWAVPALLLAALVGAAVAWGVAAARYGDRVVALEADVQETGDQLATDLAEMQDQIDRAEGTGEGTTVGDLPPTPGVVVVTAQVRTPVLAGPSPSPSPDQPRTTPRVGSGFAVAFEGGDAYVATSHALVADPETASGVVDEVVVATPDGQRATGTVHSWDRARGLALVRAPVGELPIAQWRPRADALRPGDPLAVVGLTPDAEPVRVGGTVGRADPDALVAGLPEVDFLRGAPIVDDRGRVVAVYTPGYRPFGPAAGDRQAVAPVGLFCRRMLEQCENLEAAPSPGPSEDAG